MHIRQIKCEYITCTYLAIPTLLSDSYFIVNQTTGANSRLLLYIFTVRRQQKNKKTEE